MLRAIALATTLVNAAIRIEENVPRVKKGIVTFDGWRFLGPRGAASIQGIKTQIKNAFGLSSG